MAARAPFRPRQPVLDPRHYKTYSRAAPLSTHWRTGTCEEARCEARVRGWETWIDPGTDLGRRQFEYLRHDRTRSFTMRLEGPLIVFTYPPGSECFTEHRVPLAREPLFVVRDGDWRGNPTGFRRVHRDAGSWIEDFSEHEARLERARQRG